MEPSERPPVEGAEPPEKLVKIANPVIKALLRSPLHRLVSGQLMLLSFTGRRSGRTYTLPVGRHELDGMLTVVTGSRWRLNLRGGAPVVVSLEGRRLPGRSELIEDSEEVARIYETLLDRVGVENAQRLGLRVNVPRRPSPEELRAAVTDRAVVRTSTEQEAGGAFGEEVAPGVVRISLGVVNAYLVGEPGGPWALVDTGTWGSAEKIRPAAQARFGPGSRPEAIVLTHGHPDHAGSAAELSELWDVPVYTHHLELPFLTGFSDYPPPDPTVGGPFALISRFIPNDTVDLGRRVRELPPDGEVPGLEGWRWLHTPGHTSGHIVLFRPADGVLLAGDALATMDPDSFVGMATRRQKISPPAAPVTTDWAAAERSAGEMSALGPSVVAAGHGEPMSGPEVAHNLEAFARDFPIPGHGRYVEEPARFDKRGLVSVPPAPPDPLPWAVALAGTALVGGSVTVLWLALRGRRA